jgi:hypothetical protein
MPKSTTWIEYLKRFRRSLVRFQPSIRM